MADETTIGYAVLQVIPSLRGVSEAIEEQLKGTAVTVAVEPKTDPAKVDKAVREAVKRSKPPEVRIEPKLDAAQVKKKAEEASQGVGQVLRDTINGALKDAAQDIDMPVDELKRKLGEKAGGAIGQAIGNAIGNSSLGEALQRVADRVQAAVEPMQNVRDAIEAIQNRDAAGTLNNVSEALRGMGQGDAANAVGKLNELREHAGALAGNARNAAQGINDLAGSGKGLPGLGDRFDSVGTKLDKLSQKMDKSGGVLASIIGTIDELQILHHFFEDNLGWYKDITSSLPWNHPPGSDYRPPNDPGTPLNPSTLIPSLQGPPPPPAQAAPSAPAPPAGQASGPFAGLFPGIPQRAAGGLADTINGLIRGPGTGTSDSILGWPAAVRVSNGEFITNEQATMRNLPLLQAVNAGAPLWDWLRQMPQFGGGGLVAGTEQLRKIISERFGITNIGGYRAPDGYNEHSTGRALDVMGVGAPAAAAAAAAVGTGTGGVGFEMPSSLSGLASAPFDAMTAQGEARSGPGHRDPAAYFPKAASAAVGGQVSSALGAFGVNDSPGWLQGISQLASGISVGGSGGGGGGQTVDTGIPFLSPLPIRPAAAAPAMSGPPTLPDSVHSVSAQQRPANQTIFNIQTARTEDAFALAQRRERERAAASLSRWT